MSQISISNNLTKLLWPILLTLPAGLIILPRPELFYEIVLYNKIDIK